MFSPFLACALRMEKMMSCLRERARLSRPIDSASFTSSWIGPGLQLRQIHRSPRLRELRRADDLRVVCVEHLRLMHHVVGPAPDRCRCCCRGFRHDCRRRHGAGLCWAGYGPDYQDSLSQVTVQKCRELGFGHRSDLLGLHRAVLEQDQRRECRECRIWAVSAGFRRCSAWRF